MTKSPVPVLQRTRHAHVPTVRDVLPDLRGKEPFGHRQWAAAARPLTETQRPPCEPAAHGQQPRRDRSEFSRATSAPHNRGPRGASETDAIVQAVRELAGPAHTKCRHCDGAPPGGRTIKAIAGTQAGEHSRVGDGRSTPPAPRTLAFTRIRKRGPRPDHPESGSRRTRGARGPRRESAAASAPIGAPPSGRLRKSEGQAGEPRRTTACGAGACSRTGSQLAILPSLLSAQLNCAVRRVAITAAKRNEVFRVAERALASRPFRE